MKKLYLLLLIPAHVFAMNKQAIVNQTKEDAIIIKALCDKYKINLSQVFSPTDISDNKITCSDRQAFVKVFGKFNIFNKNCAQYMLSKAKQKDRCYVWRIRQFKYLLLRYFDETKVFLAEEIEKNLTFFIQNNK